jgi:hypothetical protein
MSTALGTVKKTALDEFSNPRKAGIIAVDLDEGDHLIGAALTDGKHDVMLFSDGGKAVRFDEDDVRPMGRAARGVRGMQLEDGQSVIAMLVAEDETQSVLTATENGYGKRTSIVEYTRHGRGTKGMIAIQQSERNGKVVAATLVRAGRRDHADHRPGVLVRTRVSEIRELGRATQGVTLIALDDGAKLSGLQRIVENDANPTRCRRRRRHRRRPAAPVRRSMRIALIGGLLVCLGATPRRPGAVLGRRRRSWSPRSQAAAARHRRPGPPAGRAAPGADDAGRPAAAAAARGRRPPRGGGQADIQADMRKFAEEWAHRADRAIKIAPAPSAPMLEEKFTEDELKQLHRHGSNRRSTASSRRWAATSARLGAEADRRIKPTIEPKLQALQASMAGRASAPAASGRRLRLRQVMRIWRLPADSRPAVNPRCWRCAAHRRASTANCWRC